MLEVWAGVAIECLGMNVVAFLDLNSEEVTSEKIAGIAVRPGKFNLIQKLDALGVKSVVLSVGDNQQRAKIYEELKSHFLFPNVISPSAVIKKTVLTGDGNVILDQVYIGPETVHWKQQSFSIPARSSSTNVLLVLQII